MFGGGGIGGGIGMFRMWRLSRMFRGDPMGVEEGPGSLPLTSQRGLNNDYPDDFIAMESENERRDFVRSVFFMLSSQIMFSVCVAVPFAIYREIILKFLQQHHWVVIWFAAMFFATMICIFCLRGLVSRPPWNYVLLFIFTALEGINIGFLMLYTDPALVGSIALTTGIVVLTLGLITTSGLIDFKSWAPYMFVFGATLFLFGFICWFIPMGIFPVLPRIFCALGLIYFSFRLCYDTQRIISGRHWYRYSRHEVIFASLRLYIDILNVFMFIARLMGVHRGRGRLGP